jgi:coenzyme Q-binding protein COQ10
MPTHAEKRAVPYAPKQMFDLVADVEYYPQFLPWCLACRIVRRPAPNIFVADMMIGFKMFRERFTSEVTLHNAERIDVVYDRGPFRYLTNHWRFESDPRGMCVIDFYIDFEFRSRTLQALIGRLFNEAVQRMVTAFERRAAQLYGPAPVRMRDASRPKIAASGDPPSQ